MVKSVYVPEAGGIVDFADDLTPTEISTYINAKYPRAAPAAAAQTSDDSGIFGRFAYGLSTGLTDIPGGIAALGLPAEKAAQTGAGQFSQEARKYLESTFGIDPSKDPTTAQMLAQGLGSAAGFLVPGGAVAKGASALGMAAKGAALAGTVTAAGQGVALGAQGRAEQISQQLASGMKISEPQQLASQRLSGFIGAADALPMGKFFGPLTKILSKVPASKAPLVEKILSNRLSRLTKAGIEEGAQEAASGIANDLMEYGVYNPDVEIGQDILSNAGTGAFAGSTIEGIVQLALGRKVRGARQLQADLQTEAQKNSEDLRKISVAEAANTLAQSGVEGNVTIEPNETPEGFTVYTLMGADKKPITYFQTENDALQAVDLYKQTTGANINVDVSAPPKLSAIRIGNQKFPTLAAAADKHRKIKERVNELVRFGDNVDLVSKVAAQEGVAPQIKAKQIADEIASAKRTLAMFDRYFSPEVPEAKTKEEIKVGPKVSGAPVNSQEMPPEQPSLKPDTVVEAAPEPEAVAEPIVEAYQPEEDYTESFDAPEPITDENIPDAPIGAVEMPVEESRILPDSIVEEDAAIAAAAGPAPEAPVATVKRPSATDADLTNLQTEMFGKPIGLRNMTPEQRSAYDAERDRRFPPEDVDVYQSAGRLRDPAPRNLREAHIAGPTVKDYSPETKAWLKNVYSQLENRLEAIIPGKAKLELKTLVGANPDYLIRGHARAEETPNGIKSIVDLATGMLRPDMTVEQAVKELVGTLNHEMIHVLRDQGVIRPEEWRMLSRAATKTNIPGKKYTYLDKAEAVYTPDGKPMSPVYNDPDAVVEEAVAEMYREWVLNGQKPPQQAVGIFNRITEFLRRIFQVLRNARHDEIFKQIESGEIGKRQGEGRVADTRYSVSPIFLRSNPSYEEQYQPGTRRKETFIPDKMPASSARKAFERLNSATRNYPNPLQNDQEWVNNLSFAYNQSGNVLFPPGWAISMSNDVNSWATWMKGLTPEQLSGVDSGFASIDAISKEYKNGTATPEFTGTLLFWTYLSRMASSFPHESGFLDAAEGALPFIKKAIAGTFTANSDLLAMTSTGQSAKALKEANGIPASALPADVSVPGRSDLDDWFLFIKRSIPSYSPGNSVTNNMNSYGRDFLYNMSSTSPDGGISKLQAVHNLFSSNRSGPEIRREFHRIRDEANLGFDNKILSFAILLSGRQDVLILDRIQINQLFGGGQTNKIYDDVAGMFNGPKGLAVYEALERGLGAKVGQLYSQVGRPNNGTLGRYHWESWIRSSGQIVAHPTIQALVNLAQNKPNPFVDIASTEGRYHRSMFGVQYFKRAGGATELVYTTVDGREFSVNKNVLDTVLSKDNLLRVGAIPKWFPGVSDFEGGVSSWKDYPGVDITKVDAEIEANGRLIGNGRSNQTLNSSTVQAAAANAARTARARAAYDAANRIRWEFGRKPSGGKPTDRIPEPYSRTDHVDASGDVAAIYAPKSGVVDILAAAGVSHPNFHELSPSKKNAKKFSDAISLAKSGNEFGAAVYVYKQEQYKTMRLFLTSDGKAGFAIKEDGDIVSVFNQRGSPHLGVSIPALQLAIQLGGRKLDGFDTILPNLYSQGGMSVVSRTKFADLEGIRPEGWDYNRFSQFNAGKPDVVFMVFNPGNWSVYKPTDGQLFTSTAVDPYAAAEETYNSAVFTQTNAVFKEREATTKGAGRFSAAPLVGSREFDLWFGDSKVRNPDGSPKVVYHGTSKTGKTARMFSDNPFVAEDYARFPNVDGGMGPSIVEAYLVIKNPVSEIEMRGVDPESALYDNEWVEYQKSKGFDGYIFKDLGSTSGYLGGLNYVVFDSNQAGVKDARKLDKIAGAAPINGQRFSAAPINPQEFQRWFKNSKAVNTDGTPQRWLHGTPVSFKQFGKGRSGSVQGEDGPFFFSQNPEFVEDYSLRRNYAGGDRGDVEEGGQTIPVYLSVQNPFDYNNPKDVAAVVAKLREMHNQGRYPIIDKTDRASPEALENRFETIGYDLEDGDWPTIEKENVQRAIRELGYDGFFVKENKHRNLAVYRPEQVKSIFNRFEEGAATSGRFSAAPLPPYVQQQNSGLFAPAVNVTTKDKIFNHFSGRRWGGKTLSTMHGQIEISGSRMAGIAGKEAVTDKNAYITELEKLLNEKLTGNYQRMEANYSATAALAWRRRSSHIFASMLLRGNVEINFDRPGDIQSATIKVVDDTDSLKEIFNIITEKGPTDANGVQTDKSDIFRSYAVARRGEWLRASGQNVPAQLTPQYVREVTDFTVREYPEVVEAYNKYQRFNKKLLTTAKDAGIISQVELGRLTNQMNYYGFIYEAYGEPLGPTSSQKTASKFKLRPYTGTQVGGLTSDPMFVMMQNAQFWVDSIAKNIAATKAFELTRVMGESRILGTDEAPDELAGEAADVMFFSQNGVVKRFAVKDPSLVVALGSDDRLNVGKFWEMIGLPAHILRESVTRDPGFMARNLLRDTVSAWVTSGADFMPVIDTIKGGVTALKNGASYKALGSYGVVGSYDLAMLGPAELAAVLRRNSMPLNVHTVTTKEGAVAALGSLWNRLGHISEASDAATRIAVYDAAKKQGLSDAEAAMQAIELLDFTRRGASQALGILTKLIPFLNARIQGMDVLYQAGRSGIRYATGRSLGERDANVGKKFLLRGGMLAVIATALEALNQGDDDYEQLDDYIKTGNLILPLKMFGLEGQFLAIPKAFEVGLLFNTIPQQIYKTTTGEASTRENAQLFWGQIQSTFGVNPIPQAILPAIEILTNHSFYTGLPLISEGKLRLDPSLQYNTSTSQIAMMLGGLPVFYDMTTGRFGGMSPIVIDKLISGYGGPWGTYIVQATSLTMENASIGPDRMPTEISNLPVIRSFFIDAKSKNPKVVTQAYELFRIADEANRTMSRLRQMGDAEALANYVDQNRDILSRKKYIFTLADRLNKLSAQERSIERDTTMSRDEKLAAQQKLREIRIRLSSQVDQINKTLGR